MNHSKDPRPLKRSERILAKKKKRKRHLYALVILSCVLVACLLGAGWFWIQSRNVSPSKPQTNSPVASSTVDSQLDQPTSYPQIMNSSSFTFTGVGDNLLHDTIFVYHEQDHGNRDFTPLYEMTAPYFQNTDLAYCNFETVCAGDQFGLSGYPSFNGPTEMMDSLVSSGFDWFSISSNHSLDAGAEGLKYEKAYIQQHFPDMSATGAYSSYEDAQQPVVREINGIRVGLCGFTYGLNGYTVPQGMEWLIDVYRNVDDTINYKLIDKKLDAINALSDVQIVAMHWGDEYHNEPNEEQRTLAQYLHSKGVEVIIGTHPHVIQPVEFIESSDQTTLVYYSLGNFISAQDSNVTMVGGMANFRLNYDFNTQKASFSEIQIIPTITWISPDLRQYRTTTIHEYNDDLAANHFVSAQGMDISKAWVQQYVSSIIQGDERIQVVLE